MTRLVLIALFGSFLLVALPARAAIDAAGASHLQQMFTKYLDQKKSMYKMSQQELRADGKITVEPASGYYAVTLPHLSVYRKDGSHTDVGLFSINAVPGATAKEWQMTIAAPTPVLSYSSANQPEFRVDIGTQTFKGIWNEDIDNFSKLDAQYQNLTVDAIRDGFTVKIPKATITYNVSPDAGGKTWSGPAKYQLEDIQVIQKSGSGGAKIASAVMDMTMHSYDPEKIKAYQQKLAEMSKSVPADGKLQPADVQKIYGSVFDFIGNAWDGFDSKTTLNVIAITNSPQPPGKPETLSMKQASFLMNMNGFRSNLVTMRFDLAYNGLTITPPPSGINDVVPDHLNFDLTFDKVPFKELMELGYKGMQTAVTPEEKKKAGMQAAAVIPQLLTTAGSYARLTQSFLGNNTYNIAMDGQLNANMKAVMGADGKMKLEIFGIDALLKMMQDRFKDPQMAPAAKMNLQKSIATVTMLKAVGQEGKNAQGQDVRLYNIELNEQGKILLNGTDLSMLQAVMGVGPKPGAPAGAPAPTP